MPGVDFNRLRREIMMEEVLNLIGFEPARRAGDQWTGRCPLHESRSLRSRSFSVNVALGRYYCHKCHSHGNQFELWAAFTRRSLHPAVIDLCHALRREVPWIRRW